MEVLKIIVLVSIGICALIGIIVAIHTIKLLNKNENQNKKLAFIYSSLIQNVNGITVVVVVLSLLFLIYIFIR